MYEQKAWEDNHSSATAVNLLPWTKWNRLAASGAVDGAFYTRAPNPGPRTGRAYVRLYHPLSPSPWVRCSESGRFGGLPVRLFPSGGPKSSIFPGWLILCSTRAALHDLPPTKRRRRRRCPARSTKPTPPPLPPIFLFPHCNLGSVSDATWKEKKKKQRRPNKLINKVAGRSPGMNSSCIFLEPVELDIGSVGMERVT